MKKSKPEEFPTGNYTVELRISEDSESLIRRFIKKGKREGVTEELADRTFFKSNSVKKREASVKRKLFLKKEREKERLEIESER